MSAAIPAWMWRNLTNPTSNAVGIYGEEIAIELLQRSGYHVITTDKGSKTGDLHAISPVTGQVIWVEVKTSRRGTRGWRWTLRKDGKTDHRYADVTLLLAVLKTRRVVTFVVRTEDIRDLKSIHVPSHPENYSGKFARYRQPAWDLNLEMQS